MKDEIEKALDHSFELGRFIGYHDGYMKAIEDMRKLFNKKK